MKNLIIFSGEGERGTFEIYTGKQTPRAIRAKITREACSGDRFVELFRAAGPEYADNSYFEIDPDTMEPTGEMRTIRPDQIEGLNG